MKADAGVIKAYLGEAGNRNIWRQSVDKAKNLLGIKWPRVVSKKVINSDLKLFCAGLNII